MKKVERIQVCTDGSPLSDKAVDEAIALAQLSKASLIVMTATSGKESERDSVRERMKKVAQRAKEASVAYELVVEEAKAPFEGIVAVAKKHNVDYVVMASRGLGTVGSLFLGSETQKVLASIDRPVLVVR